ncbi:unnamed protein product [Closterium sp. Naga37s-1]|nr:unnamed protein product [Closterium sp. Naga37s-1]
MDALRLDDEMRLMLKEQLMRVFALVPAAWVARCEAEVELLLDVLVWRFSVWADRPLPGCALMNLRFRDERTARAGAGAAAPPAVPVRTGVEGPGLTVGQKVLWLVLTGGVKYVWARLHSTRWLLPVHAHMPPNAYGRHGFRTLPERLLGIRAVYAKPHMARAVSFEYMNRQLVWNEFSVSHPYVTSLPPLPPTRPAYPLFSRSYLVLDRFSCRQSSKPFPPFSASRRHRPLPLAMGALYALHSPSSCHIVRNHVPTCFAITVFTHACLFIVPSVAQAATPVWIV